MAMKKYRKSESGFTLIELLIVVAIIGIVLAGVVGLFTRTSSLHTAQEMMVETAQRIRSAKTLMVDEIRSAGCNPEGDERMGFELGTGDDRFDTDANSIHFTRDIDNGDLDELYEPDGDAEDANEDVSYYRIDDAGSVMAATDTSTGTLVRNTGGGGMTVVEDVVRLEFKYYDSDNNEIDPTTMTKDSVLSTIRTVEVFLEGQVQNPNITSAGNSVWAQQFRIRVRNL